MSVTIYMPLVDDGVECWRPVHAALVRDDVYEVEVDQEPKGEKWEFPPRSLVRCREHVFDDGETGLLAFELVESPAFE